MKRIHKKSRPRFPLAATAVLTASAIGISLFVAKSDSTFAWYNDTAAGGTSTVAAAAYTVAWQSVNEFGEEISNRTTLGLEPDDLHYYTLTANGTASKGYVQVDIKNENAVTETCYISPISPGQVVTVVLHAASGSSVSFSSGWGDAPSSDNTIEPYSVYVREENPPLIAYLDISGTPMVEYEVPERATLEAIAGHYRVDPQDILTYNDIDRIYPGNTIHIPNPVTEEPYVPPLQYVVQDGDTPQMIADLYGVPLKALLAWNCLSENSCIYEGMTLTIPVVYGVEGKVPDATEPEANESETTETEVNESESLETENTETGNTETENTETGNTESGTTETETTETENTEAGNTEAESTGSGTTETETTETENTETGNTETENTETESTETESTETETTESETTETETTESETTETETTESETTVTETTQTETTETVTTETETEEASEEEDDTVYVNKVPRYFQTDFPEVPYGNGTVETSGCSVTSLTMVANAVTGYDYTVDELADYFGGRALSNIDRLKTGSKTLGLSFHESKNFDFTWQALKEGKIVIALMDGYQNNECLFTNTQHFIVLTGMTEDGERVLVNDPNRDNYDLWNLKGGFEEGFNREDLLAGYSGGWIYDRELEEQPERYSEERVSEYYVASTSESGVAVSKNYPEIQLTESERELLARMIWVEAQGECDAGQQAVAEVVFNRLLSPQFGDTINDVIYAENQFLSVPKLDEAEPGQAQYQAIDRALYGEPILPRNVYYFATFPRNTNFYMSIGNHIFCY